MCQLLLLFLMVMLLLLLLWWWWCCCLVGHLVSPLLHGLHDLLHDGGLGDGAGGRGHE